MSQNPLKFWDFCLDIKLHNTVVDPDLLII